MRLGIDASNIRAGGGVTHLVELLRAAKPSGSGFSHIVVWGGRALLDQIENRPWLHKNHQVMLDKSLPYRSFWQRYELSKKARSEGCHILFVPGGSYSGSFRPVVAMSQNLLPFEWREMRRYGFSWMTLKMLMLRFVQSRTFQQAEGLIFLSQYARETIQKVVCSPLAKHVIIPHGIKESFLRPPSKQSPICSYSDERPMRILYVSKIDMYKHQWHVAEAVAELRKRGTPIVLDLVGPAYPKAMKRLQRALKIVNNGDAAVRYLGEKSFDDMHTLYSQTDLCLFASSCENLPNILIEGMASGAPIACSRRGPMPEVLGDDGFYFNPEDVTSIIDALSSMIGSPDLREKKARNSFVRARSFSWVRCAKQTLAFISEVAHSHPVCASS